MEGKRLQISPTVRKDLIVFIVYSLSRVLTLLQPHGLKPAAVRLLCPCDFPGKNTGVGCYFLLQGIFPTPGLNRCLLHPFTVEPPSLFSWIMQTEKVSKFLAWFEV